MKPTLNFFRAWPENLEQLPPLTSSMQSLETCFLLLSYVRYPHALVSCVTAIESAIRAKLGLASEERIRFSRLLKAIQSHPYNFKALSQKSLDELRESRNICDYGISLGKST
jgi:hypothetical protein